MLMQKFVTTCIFIIIIIKTESVIPRVKERKGCGETDVVKLI